MKVLLILSVAFAVATCGIIHHDTEDHKATSYQNIHIEHFHSVPTYVKKEDAHFLEHPVSKGKTSAKVEVHHGGKHDHGYAIADTHTDLQHHGGDEYGGHEGGHSYGFVAVGGEGGHGHEEHHEGHHEAPVIEEDHQEYHQVYQHHEGGEEGHGLEAEHSQHLEVVQQAQPVHHGYGLGHYH